MFATAARTASVETSRPSLPLRLLLLIGSSIAVAGAAQLGHPDAYMQADPQLAHLLRGMAIIKACIAIAALGAVGWRLTYPLAFGATAAYLLGAWLMAGCSVLIWQLAFIPAAAIGFHVGGFMVLVASLRDEGLRVRMF